MEKALLLSPKCSGYRLSPLHIQYYTIFHLCEMSRKSNPESESRLAVTRGWGTGDQGMTVNR